MYHAETFIVGEEGFKECSCPMLQIVKNMIEMKNTTICYGSGPSLILV